MAKQSGIHQLRGKVGEHSYYRQTGIVPGLVRGINQGMSARVKTDEAYANTRLNNVEFKGANQLATASFNSVPNRKKGMMVNFALARMTKRALEAIKAGSGPWGQRRPTTPVDQLAADMLENYAKLGKYDGEYGTVSLSPLDAQGECDITFSISNELATELSGKGIDSITFVVQAVAVGSTASGSTPFFIGGSAFAYSQREDIVAGEGLDSILSVSFGDAANVGMRPEVYAAMRAAANHGFMAIVSILPARTIDSEKHILQEQCTYTAIAFGKIPTT